MRTQIWPGSGFLPAPEPPMSLGAAAHALCPGNQLADVRNNVLQGALVWRSGVNAAHRAPVFIVGQQKLRAHALLYPFRVDALFLQQAEQPLGRNGQPLFGIRNTRLRHIKELRQFLLGSALRDRFDTIHNSHILKNSTTHVTSVASFK